MSYIPIIIACMYDYIIIFNIKNDLVSIKNREWNYFLYITSSIFKDQRS